MILETKDKNSLSDARIDKAKEFLSDAHAIFNERRYRSSINRAYHAALNAARSLLILEGSNPETREGWKDVNNEDLTP